MTDDVRRVPRYMPQIEVAVASLHAFPENYQGHPAEQLKHLCESLELGQWKGIVIWRGPDTDLDAGQYYILAGHGLVGAARAGGYTHLVAQDWSALSLDDARRLLVADNETAKLATPDNARLLALVEQVRATGRTVPGVTSERLAEIAALARKQNPPPVEDAGAQVDKAAELQERWGTATGQIWMLGTHRLAVGDCTDPAVVAAVMQGERAGAVVTDPPYGVGVHYDGFEDTRENLLPLIDRFMRATADMRPMALTPGVPAMWDYPRPDWVMAWIHPAATSSGPWGFIGVNPILVYGNDPYLKAGLGRRHGHIVAADDRKGLEGHPVGKPLGVWEWLVERVTIEAGAIVFDPFAGSGTTLVACQNLGRKCRAIEISPAYCAVTLQRMTDTFPGITISRLEATPCP